MNAHDKRTLEQRLQWIADWSEPGIDLADAGTAREALERIQSLTAENARLRAKLELTPENVERVAKALCRRPGSLCVGFCHSSRCADAIATFGDDATAAIKALGADQ